jgi:hypothetical protein
VSFEAIDEDLDEVYPPTVSPWRGFVAAITGRRIAAHVTTHDDAVSELHAVQQQLAAAQAQIADMGAEIAQLHDDLTGAVKAADQLRSERNSLRAANRGLMRIADGRGAVVADRGLVDRPEAMPMDELRRQADQDRRNAVRLENQLAQLEGRDVR